MTLLAATSLTIMRHIQRHHGATRPQIEALQLDVKRVGVRLSSLCMQGFLESDRSTQPATYRLTPAGANALIAPRAPAAPRSRERLTAVPPRASLTPVQSTAQPASAPAPTYRPLPTFAPRPGAMNAYSMPSRMGNRLYFRDGTVEDTTHGAQTP